VLVRSWNLFHGNAQPPESGSHLEAMIRLAVADGPDVLCLQELPLWSFRRLAAWSGMQVFADAAAAATLGPLPWTPELGRRVTALRTELLRSALTGQGNAILVRRGLPVEARRRLVLNSPAFRRAQARVLGLPLLARLAWAKERRICQALRLRLPDGRGLVVANLHATSYRLDDRLADAELLRAAVFADGIARPDEACVLAGDFNVTPRRSRTLLSLLDWGFSAPGPGIDHVLVRGAGTSPLETWPLERRRVDGLVLSDHAPVEASLA
jgi:endonuclease/exonuclease/phosphatase family metal-dependent hydrolase